ncbi:MAG: hypothetical protein A3G80_01005 [Betaproteobacteria bacterium RIFCSPLOWO2_12_FULL_62_13b]|nr:MAG: hypothetical protein A3G80_01005 [Betaproteobacteria bacterium RIFCSPLOWO2_12_FULL_62_13b]
MSAQALKAVLISDFNVANLAAYLRNDAEPPVLEPVVAPYGQVIVSLMSAHSASWEPKPDVLVVWTRPGGVVPSFERLMQYEQVELGAIFSEVDEFAAAVLGARERAGFILVPSWNAPSHHRGFGLLDMKAGLGVRDALMRMNLRLADRLHQASNIYVLDASKWVEAVGARAFEPKLWYTAKIPFGNDVFIEAAKDIKAAVWAMRGASRKLIVLDLDNTLWGGIVGDLGWENLRLGGHDHIGEAYLDFQKMLRALTRRGILLAVASKNEEAVALEAIEKHPEMVLRLKDFAGWRINWGDKAENIADLVAELNLGLESAVFIDDDPVERARVRESLTDVLVPEWPEDAMLYAKTLLGLRCFDSRAVSQEDLSRVAMYTSERRRREARIQGGSVEGWLRTLGIRVRIEALTEANLQRAAQLLNKTNQLNLTTRRLTEGELLSWGQDSGRRVWTYRASDRFGDTGLVGILSLEIEHATGRVVDFVLSCRVMGRGVEEAMLFTALQHAESVGLKEVQAYYLPTAKNKPCLEFWKRSGLEYDERSNCFSWRFARPYPRPEHVGIEWASGETAD